MNEPKVPMGVSQWRNHGEKYHYWEYFEQRVTEELLTMLEREGEISAYRHERILNEIKHGNYKRKTSHL